MIIKPGINVPTANENNIYLFADIIKTQITETSHISLA